jgi:hypothetical protein
MSKQSMSLGGLMRVTGGFDNCPEVAFRIIDIVESTCDSASIKRWCVRRPPDRIAKLEPVLCAEKRLQFRVGSICGETAANRQEEAECMASLWHLALLLHRSSPN